MLSIVVAILAGLIIVGVFIFCAGLDLNDDCWHNPFKRR